MTKRILLIYPPYFAPSHIKRILSGNEELTLGAPLGLMYITAYLKKQGFAGDIALVDYMDMIQQNREILNDDGFLENVLARRLETFQPDVAAVTLNFSVGWNYFVTISKALRRLSPKTIIIAGGGHATFSYKAILENKLADYVVRGEGEYAFHDLIMALGSGKETGIQGIYNSEKARGAIDEHGRIFDFNEIVMPDWSIVNTDSYIRKNPSFRYLGKRNDVFAQIVTTRGCPYRCSFCAGKNAYGNKMRARPIQNILAEIDYLKQEHGITGIIPEDDMFLNERKRSLDLLANLSRVPGITIAVRNGLSVGALDQEIVDAMVRANVTTCNIAIDGGTDEIQKSIRKNCNLSKAREITKYIRNQGIETCANMIIGHYEETKEMINKAIEYIMSLESDWLNLQVCAPLPGSDFYFRLCDEGIIRNTADFWSNDFEGRNFTLNGITSEEINRIRQDIYYRFNYHSNKNIQQGKYERALIYFDRRCDLKDKDLFSHAYKAHCLYAIGRGQEADLIMGKIADILCNENARKTFIEYKHCLPARVVDYAAEKKLLG